MCSGNRPATLTTVHRPGSDQARHPGVSAGQSISVAFTAGMIRGEEPYSPAIFVTWGPFFAIVAGLVLNVT